MTANKRSKSNSMSIRSWLRLAAIIFIGLASLSGLYVYEIVSRLQYHAEAGRHSSRLLAAKAELASNVSKAWLSLERGDRGLAALALADLRRSQKMTEGIVDELSARQGQYSFLASTDSQMYWSELDTSLAGLIKVAEPIVSRGTTIRPAAGPQSTFSLDRTAFDEFNNHLKASIDQASYLSVESHSTLLWVSHTLLMAALFSIGGMVAYGLFVLFFVDHRVRARATEVSSRVLQYTSGTFSPPSRRPLEDEFGLIEAQIDECAQIVHSEQLKVANAHQETLRQLEARTDELGKLNEALKVSGRALVRFLTDISHDLRTPLAIMVGESEVSLRSQSTSVEEYKETLSRMLEQTRYLGSLVDQLLYTARSRVSAVPLEPAHVDVTELVRLACRDMKTLANKHDVEIETSGELKTSVVLGDKTRLREMMLTILDNAIEYSKPGGTITVSVVARAPYTKITVADTGIGIPASEMPMIFRRFYRAQNAPEANSQGTGIGLAVAKGIVESHNGTIEIESTEHRGTMVTLNLPLVDPSQLNAKLDKTRKSVVTDEVPSQLLN